MPGGHQFHSFVTTLVSNGITAGIGGGLYGVGDNTLRQQMAVFLLKAKHGLCYTPPPCDGGLRATCPVRRTFAHWIEALAAEGITGGCGGGNYCPQNPVRRDQMAVFLLKADARIGLRAACLRRHSSPTCRARRTFADWIEELAARASPAAAAAATTARGNFATRGQMAMFITKTFAPAVKLRRGLRSIASGRPRAQLLFDRGELRCPCGASPPDFSSER